MDVRGGEEGGCVRGDPKNATQPDLVEQLRCDGSSYNETRSSKTKPRALERLNGSKDSSEMYSLCGSSPGS